MDPTTKHPMPQSRPVQVAPQSIGRSRASDAFSIVVSGTPHAVDCISGLGGRLLRKGVFARLSMRTGTLGYVLMIWKLLTRLAAEESREKKELLYGNYIMATAFPAWHRTSPPAISVPGRRWWSGGPQRRTGDAQFCGGLAGHSELCSLGLKSSWTSWLTVSTISVVGFGVKVYTNLSQLDLQVGGNGSLLACVDSRDSSSLAAAIVWAFVSLQTCWKPSWTGQQRFSSRAWARDGGHWLAARCILREWQSIVYKLEHIHMFIYIFICTHIHILYYTLPILKNKTMRRPRPALVLWNSLRTAAAGQARESPWRPVAQLRHSWKNRCEPAAKVLAWHGQGATTADDEAL